MELAEIYVEARNPERNCLRAYRVTLTRDLFSVFIVEIRYGRIGSYGHTLARSFEAEIEARRFMDTCLRRRQSSPSRIGTSYVQRECFGESKRLP